MTLTQDQRVLADSAIETVFEDGTATIHGIVRGEEGKDFWVYPLTDEVVERLAIAGHDHYWSATEEDSPSESVMWNGFATIEEDRILWRSVVRRIFAELMDGGER